MSGPGRGPGRGPSIAVVVPTRDRPSALAACLAAIAAQDRPAHEVVVVDDGSLDRAAVAAVVAEHPEARLVVGEGRGPAAARNLGIRSANSAVVALTDDDCRPSPGWLAALAASFEGGAEVVAGPTVTTPGASAPIVAAQVVTNHLVFDSLDPAGSSVGFAPTSALAAQRDLLLALPFDEGFPLAAGEDRAWCRTLAERGTAISWAPAATVVHHPDLDLRRFWRQQVRYGRGAHRWHRTQPAGKDRPRARFYVGLVRRGFADGPVPGALVIAAQLATAQGFAAEALSSRGSTPSARRGL